MAFDSNPQAVYHGIGYAELREVASLTVPLGTSRNVRAPTVGKYVVPEGDRLLAIEIDHPNASVDGLQFVRSSLIPEMSPFAAPSATNSVRVTFAAPVIDTTTLGDSVNQITLNLARDDDRELGVGASARIAGGSVTVRVYEVK